MKSLFFAIVTFVAFSVSTSVFAQESPRVPAIFTGNSPAPEYQNFKNYRYKADSRDSRGFGSYKLDLNLLDRVRQQEGIQSVHAHVRNIARDGNCPGFSQCFRVFVYVNGDENGGHHVATFVVSPGTGRRTPLHNATPLKVYNREVRWLKSYEKPGQYRHYDMYRIYGSKSYPGKIPNMPNAMFISNGIALHGSFDTVDGNKRSHGCVRMFPDESYWLNSLVREADAYLTVDVLHTR